MAIHPSNEPASVLAERALLVWLDDLLAVVPELLNLRASRSGCHIPSGSMADA